MKHPGSKTHNNIFRKTDGRVKLISAILFVLLITTINSWYNLASVFFIYLMMLWIMGFPFHRHLKPLVLPIFMVGIMSSLMGFAASAGEGMERGLILFLRAACAIFVINTVVSSMALQDLLYSIKSLKLPGIIVNLMGFTARYADIFSKEMARMMTARKSRGYFPGKNLWHFSTMKVIGQTVGILFLRSYERSERVYFSMLSRGYSDRIIPSKAKASIKARDFLVGILIVAIPITFKVAEMRGISWITLWK